MDGARFARAIAAIDAANADDPHTIVVRGTVQPKEIGHARLVTEWVGRLAADPSEELLLAARAHHLRRWTIPRESYPDGRSGYLRWRRALHQQHSRDVAAILREVGYEPAVSDRVEQLVAKRGLGEDPDAQVLEDALCLTFIETQLNALSRRLEHAKMIEIIRKTAAKMSPAAVATAAEMDLDAGDRALLVAALRDAPGRRAQH